MNENKFTSVAFVVCGLHCLQWKNLLRSNFSAIFVATSNKDLYELFDSRCGFIENIYSDYKRENIIIKNVVGRSLINVQSEERNLIARSLQLSAIRAEVKSLLNSIRILDKIEYDIRCAHIFSNYVGPSDFSPPHSINFSWTPLINKSLIPRGGCSQSLFVLISSIVHSLRQTNKELRW